MSEPIPNTVQLRVNGENLPYMVDSTTGEISPADGSSEALAAVILSRREGETMTGYQARINAAVRAAAPPVKWKHLGVRVTVEEHDQIAAAAKARGITVSDFVRQIAREVAG